MTTLEAFDIVLDKLEEFKKEGIDVNIIPHKSRNNKDIIKKYNSPDRVPPDYWFHVDIKIKQDEDMSKITSTISYLNECGITFDYGTGFGCFDWELDFSFQYTGNEDKSKTKDLNFFIDITKPNQ